MSMPDAVAADAPGRVNLIGEHTDYHDGYVLPMVIPQRTHVRLTPRGDREVHARSTALPGAARYELGRESRQHDWTDYVQGVTHALASRGYVLGGFDAEISSTVPTGAGVSSSAALEVSLLRALRLAFALPLDAVEVARIARAAETDFVGAPVGIMDQMASSIGRDGEALFIDTRSLATERVALPRSLDVVVLDSGVTHAHAGGAYAQRRRESFDAAAQLGVDTLRDVGVDALPRVAQLPPLLARRARHIVTENARVLDAVDALRRADLPRLGALFRASHASMRDDFETSTPDIDTLVRHADAEPDVYGARLTGGGFGGAVVVLARQGTGAAVAARVAREYSDATGCAGRVLVAGTVLGR
jgi:galactokinase